MKRTAAFIIAAFSILALLSGCATEPGKTPSSSAGDAISRYDAVITEHYSFASFDDFDSYLDKYISSVTGGRENYMVSPLSFKYALALLTAGAEGETKAELLSALGMRSEEDLTRQLVAFSEFSKKYDEDLETEVEQFKKSKAAGYYPKDAKEPFRALRVANSVWRSTELVPVDFKASYSEKISRDYSSEFFKFTSDDVIDRVNSWANKKTEGMIPRLLSDDYDTSNLAVILMNALYFKDGWKKGFSSTDRIDSFTAFDGTKTEKVFITSTQEVLWYKSGDTELVSVPMAGGISMLFVLGDGDGAFDMLKKAEKTDVEITIPEIEIESSFTNGEFMGFLKSAGVNLVFDPAGADLSGMFDPEKLDFSLYVSDIIQKTKLKLDKDGVEAAAVTALMLGKGGVSPSFDEKVSFTADRPFAFFIFAESNGENIVLFEGRVVK